MQKIKMFGVVAVAAIFSFTIPSTTQAADPAIKCESGKLKEAGKYASCRLKADSKGVKKSETPDYTKCETKFSDKWGKAETKAGPGICPSEGDAVSMDARITTDAAEIATLLAGGSLPASCGNGTVDAGEDCDFGDLGGETCATQGLFGDGLACGVGCVFDTSGCSVTRYEDTGLGTVIDHQTGLEWQKTDNAGGLTDKDNTYTWTGDGFGGTAANGTAFVVFLEGLNGGTSSSGSGPTTPGYAGHNDWRMPRIEELTTIVDCSFGNPCIDQSVFGATNASSIYWSSSTAGLGPDGAWDVTFDGGGTINGGKVFDFQVRAVRGGS